MNPLSAKTGKQVFTLTLLGTLVVVCAPGKILETVWRRRAAACLTNLRNLSKNLNTTFLWLSEDVRGWKLGPK
jgi:hypothetical protein